MKKTLVLLSCIILLFLTGCSSNKGPSASDVNADLASDIAEKQVNAVMKKADVSKSIVDGQKYEATYEVTVSTQYSERKYTADVVYTKYDQGWMADKIDWEIKDCILTGFPDDEDIENYVLPQILSNHPHLTRDGEVLSIAGINTSDTLVTNDISIYFDVSADYAYHTEVDQYYSALEYDVPTDDWVLREYSNSNLYTEIGHINTYKPYDFSGTWGNLIIKNYTGESVDISIPGTVESFIHFEEVSPRKYTSMEGFELNITYKKNLVGFAVSRKVSDSKVEVPGYAYFEGVELPLLK